MGRPVKVTLKRIQWGRQVMASEHMQDHMGNLGAQVADRLPGSTVRVTVGRVLQGGSRARATITTPIPMKDEAETGEALAALRAVVPTGHRTKKRRR